MGDEFSAARRADAASLPGGGRTGAHALAALYECNERFLDLLRMHAGRTPGVDPFSGELRPLLLQLDADARRRVAHCPVLLADLGFGDGRRWARALDGEAPGLDYAPPPWFGPEAVEVMRVILFCTAHLAWSDPVSARLLLGLSPGCVEAFAGGTVSRASRLADSHWPWLRPRWLNRRRYWRELLQAGMHGTPASLARARVRGLRLLAGDARPE